MKEDPTSRTQYQSRENRVPGANGFLQLEPSIFGIRGAPWVVVGGPFEMCPSDYFGVCLLERYPDSAQAGALHLPIKDFSIPTNDSDVLKALRATIQQLLDGQQVYVGCAAGWGRTGLFLSLLAKIAGEADPIRFVRDNYAARAVETTDQLGYVDRFRVTGLRIWLLWNLLKAQREGVCPRVSQF